MTDFQKSAGDDNGPTDLTPDTEAREGASRVSFRLSAQARDAVDEIIKLAKLDTIQDAIRRALSDELFLLRERKDGWAVLLKKGTKYREVQWPDI